MATEVTERRGRQLGTLRGVRLAMLVLLWWRGWSLGWGAPPPPLLPLLTHTMGSKLCELAVRLPT